MFSEKIKVELILSVLENLKEPAVAKDPETQSTKPPAVRKARRRRTWRRQVTSP